MNRHVMRGCELCAAWIIAASGAQAQTFPFPVSVPISIERHATRALSTYTVDALPFILGRIVAPDGTEFTTTTLAIEGLSSEELTTRFVGEWTLFDMFFIPGGVPQEHRFTIAASQLTSGFPPSIPIVTSPAEGAVVPRVFSVTWDDDDSSGFTYRIVGGVSPRDGRRIADDNFEFTAVFEAGEGPKNVTFTAFNDRTTDLANATPNVSNPERRFYPSIIRRAASLPRNFAVLNVPEPATAALLVLALPAWLWAGRSPRLLARRAPPPVDTTLTGLPWEL